MGDCIICKASGKQRKYFSSGKELCDAHYIAYLEFLIKDMDEETTGASANDAFIKLELSLKPTPAPIPEPKLFSTSSDDEEEDTIYSRRMGM